MANPRTSTRTRKPKPPPVEPDLAVRIFQAGAHARGRGPDGHFAFHIQDRKCDSPLRRRLRHGHVPVDVGPARHGITRGTAIYFFDLGQDDLTREMEAAAAAGLLRAHALLACALAPAGDELAALSKQAAPEPEQVRQALVIALRRRTAGGSG